MTQTAVRSVATDIETIRRRIALFEDDVRRHPLARLIARGDVPAATEKAFALYMFTDAWMWPSMLIAMRDHAGNAKLKRAISDNLDDEAGERGHSHIHLSARFLKSLGIAPALTDMPELNRTVAIAGELSEAQTAGWLAAAEMLTLPLYELALACFGKKTGVDTRYLDVHMVVDEDHIAWLWAAVESLVEEGADAAGILEGVGLGARATLKSLDQIYEESLAEGAGAGLGSGAGAGMK